MRAGDRGATTGAGFGGLGALGAFSFFFVGWSVGVDEEAAGGSAGVVLEEGVSVEAGVEDDMAEGVGVEGD